MIKPNSTILFQGDSITDCQRKREITEANGFHALGDGYCNLLAGRLLKERPRDNLKFYNRGISGNRVVDLYARWKTDAINLKPDIISILVGINDTWHEFGSQNGVEPERYKAVYEMMLSYTKEKLPKVQLILCEPFALQCGVVTEEWMDEVCQRQQIVRQLAKDFSAVFAPFQSAINHVAIGTDPKHWLIDGVHPTPAGHQILAECWYGTVIHN